MIDSKAKQDRENISVPDRIPVTVMIFTLNEEINLPYCLDSLAGFDEVIVIDSFSTDQSEKICRQRDIEFYQHRFEGFGSQRNWAFANVPSRHDWILVLDADERVPPELAEEIRIRINQVPETVGAYRLKRRFYLWGRWLKYSSLYPTWVVRLVHKEKTRYINRGHAETQQVNGVIADLAHDLIDENHKGIDEWFERQSRYASKDAEYELSQAGAQKIWPAILSRNPLARRAAFKAFVSRLPARGWLYFIYAYVWRRGFLDGRDGLEFCRMRAMYQTLVTIKKYDMQKNRSSRDSQAAD
ncbi:MAG: glycosyltransferase family 2 protein [Proteobacteria bacterium]|nr:glycosyltransferase family 2 protein [Pseudomonadota bacterium]